MEFRAYIQSLTTLSYEVHHLLDPTSPRAEGLAAHIGDSDTYIDSNINKNDVHIQEQKEKPIFDRFFSKLSKWWTDNTTDSKSSDNTPFGHTPFGHTSVTYNPLTAASPVSLHLYTNENDSYTDNNINTYDNYNTKGKVAHRSVV